MHEAKMHKHNCFLTLTLNDDNLSSKYTTHNNKTGKPALSGSLDKSQLQKFWKRLRKHIGAGAEGLLIHSDEPAVHKYSPNGETGQRPSLEIIPRHKIKYYAAGEYGSDTGRPHYHACVFGLDFKDKKYLRKSPAGHKLYRSATLEKLWPLGFSSIGEVNFETAAYVARYVMKKINGKDKEKKYEKIDIETGEIIKTEPESNYMSRRPGLGSLWLEKYTADVYQAQKGQVIVRGKPSNAPRYYDKIYKKKDPYGYTDLKSQREIEIGKNWLDNTVERLRVKEEVTTAKISQLKRKL